MATATATRQEEREVCGDAIGNDDISTNISDHYSSDEAYTQTSVDNWDDASGPGGVHVAIDNHTEHENVLPHSAMPGAIRRRVILVEFCTNPDSRIGKLAPPGVGVVRLTINDDLTTPAGLAKAIEAVTTPDAIVILFGTLL